MADTAFTPSRSRSLLVVRLRRRCFRSIPLLVWCGAIVAIFCLADIQRAPLPYPGMVQVTRYTVTAPTQARLMALMVKKADHVEPDQLVGSLDGADLQLRLERARAEVSRLQAEMTNEAALLRGGDEARRADRLADLRRFRRDRENAHLDVLDKRAEIEAAKIQLIALADTLRRTAILAKEDFDSQAELIDARAAHDTLARQIKDDQGILKDRQAKLAGTEKRLAEYLALRPSEPVQVVDAAAPLSWAVKAQQVELEEIALLRTRLSLRAPGRGKVEHILARQGELLVAGQPLLTIVDTEARAIVAYVPERDLGRVRPGMRAQVSSLARSHVAETKGMGIGLTVEQVPEQLWADPRRPEWGRLVHLDMPSTFAELPGSGLRVRLLPE
ncbi:MAG: HlyD family secretion protein [Planctomycetota bacterium]|jgi:multidrug resistance efflux pump